MGLDNHAGADANTRAGYEYIICRVTGAVDSINILHEEHPRLLSHHPRCRFMDSDAMVCTPLEHA